MDNLRCFVAIDFPDEVKTALVRVRDELKKWPGRVNWVAPGNYHLTLKFLGHVPTADIPAITAALKRAAAGQPAFKVQLKGLGAFPNLSRPRIIWVGMTGETEALQSLQHAVDRELKQLGMAAEAGPYKPHLTLGRVKEPAGPDLAEVIKSLKPVDIGPVMLNEILLMQSRLSGAGPAYSRLAGILLDK